jgi:hypothetical protein
MEGEPIQMCNRSFAGHEHAMEGSDDDVRRAANEATFREANERIRETERDLDPPLERVPYFCECDDTRCRETIGLTAEEYERIRADGATFAIVPGHPTRGDVVQEQDGYLIVRKPDVGGEVARALDPRERGT